ncbi:MAG: chromophore lyase CpcT/CpeT [Candidatus Eisenbacteria bacterium]|nr:chromophore lyase CpcT/CpeT [Candidatus Eisenbacteria bacterium]
MRARVVACALALAALHAAAAGAGRDDGTPADTGVGVGGGPPLADRVAGLLAGSFSSRAQAEADSSYYDIRLEMAPIWAGRDDGRWLYVEQAVAGAEERPYRQRVYRVTDDGAQVRSDVYVLPRPERFVGAWGRPDAFDALNPDSLSLREGCEVLLRPRADGSFEGGTEGRGCASDLRGAAYATSTVLLSPDGLVTWDRGFDESGEQVWGAVTGGYVFDRVERDHEAR